MKKGFAAVFILGFVAVSILFGATIYLKQKQYPKSVVQPSTTHPSSSLPSPLSATNEAKTPYSINWKTYTNSEYGFELKYPVDWSAKEGTHVFYNDFITIGTGKNKNGGFNSYFTVGGLVKTNLEVEQWIKDEYCQPGNCEYQVSEENINGLNFSKVYTCGFMCITYFHIKKDEYIYTLVLNSYTSKDKSSDDQTLINILHMFKFLN